MCYTKRNLRFGFLRECCKSLFARSRPFPADTRYFRNFPTVYNSILRNVDQLTAAAINNHCSAPNFSFDLLAIFRSPPCRLRQWSEGTLKPVNDDGNKVARVLTSLFIAGVRIQPRIQCQQRRQLQMGFHRFLR